MTNNCRYFHSNIRFSHHIYFIYWYFSGYIGCVDKITIDVNITGTDTTNSGMTSTFCIQLCRGQDAAFAGIHSSTTCQCYSGLQSYTLLSSSCLSCPGYRAQACGSSESISVFNVCKFNIMLKYVLQWPSRSCSWSYVSWIYSYLCNHYISPLTFWDRTPLITRCIRYNIMW
jgi:hypothetical protein